MSMTMNHGTGTPWLTYPMSLHSSRKYNCTLKTTAQCKYQQGRWRFWYEADHRYALPTTAFFLTVIILFAFSHFFSLVSRGRTPQSRILRKLIALKRYLSYRSYRIKALNWNSAPLGILLLGAVGAIFFFAITLGPKPYYWPNQKKPPLSFGNSPPIATRSGWISLACLPFIIATSPKSNFITALTGVSHERLQVFHRWISYASFILALIHTFPFVVVSIWKGTMEMQWHTSVYYWTGVVALLAQAWLTFASISPLRNWCYEFFKAAHFVAAVIFVVFFFFHCNLRLSSADYFIAIGVIYSLCWLHSHIRIFFEHGLRSATVSLVSNDFIKVTIPSTTSWRPGQHFFVRFYLGVHHMTAHPFTACSLPRSPHAMEERPNELIFYIRPQGGFTARLAKRAATRPNATLRVLLDGPYGGIDMSKFATSKSVLAIAGGSGAGWLLPLIEVFLRRKDLPTGVHYSEEGGIHYYGGPKIRAVLATRDLATKYWFEQAVSDLLATSTLEGVPPGSRVEIYYTRAESHEPTSADSKAQNLSSGNEKAHEQTLSISATHYSSTPSVSGTDSAFRANDISSRPALRTLVAEAAHDSDSLAVLCCGPLSMQNDVANAVAAEQVKGMRNGKGDVWLHMEHFSWA